MDDLYGNAWDDPVKLDSDEPPSLNRTHTWTSPKLPLTTQDEEADLAVPSWSTGADIRWNEPSEDSHGFAWSAAEPDLAWTSSTYEDIQLGKPAVVSEEEEVGQIHPSPDSPAHSTEEEPSSPLGVDYQALGVLPEPPSTTSELSHTDSDKTENQIRPPSPDGDGFGSFESAVEGNEVDVHPDSLDVPPDLAENAWGSAWASESKDSESSEEPPVLDEWEQAKLEKEKLDSIVPPEYVAELLTQCREFCRTVFPEVDTKFVDKDPESWRNDLHRGMESVNGIEELKQKWIPELSPQPPIRFEKTSVAKNMTQALRLTRNLPIVKQSPMSLYLSNKGNTAWEEAVKDRKIISEDDVVPVGWKILEKDSEKSTAAPQPQKSGSRLLSFFTRRQSTAPSTISPTPANASTKTSISSTSVSKSSPANSARNSISSSTDLQKSTTSTVTSSPDPELPSSGAALPAASRSISAPGSNGPSRSSTPAPTSYADGGLPDLDKSESAPPVAPSAVSRFLNRFSRRRTAVPTSPNSSIALSSDDLAFLSDIVPSASDDTDDILLGLSQPSLSQTLKPEPLPPILPPPPSAPVPASRPQSTGVSPTSTASPTLLTAQSNKILPFSPPANATDTLLGTSSNVSQTGSVIADLASLRSISPQTSSRPQSPISSTAVSGVQVKEPAIPTSLSSVLSAPTPQPFVLPPPIPPPQSRTPTPTMPVRDHKLPALDMKSKPSTLPSRAKIPSALTELPPPSIRRTDSMDTPSTSPTSTIPLGQLYPVNTSSGDRPPTPMSAKPLAELYPNAAKSKPSAISGPTAFSNPLHAFTIPPPPSSRSNTPVAKPAIQVPALSPPPEVPRASSLSSNGLTISLTSFGDDDDFDDFQSFSPAPTETPVSAPAQSSIPLMSSFTPPSVTSKPATTAPPRGNGWFSSSVLPPPPPPPSSSLKPLTSSQSAKTSQSDSFDDEFDDFLSPSASTPMSGSSLLNSQSSKRGLLGIQTPPQSDFDFGGISPPTLRTPSPPRPPQKQPALSAPKDGPVVVKTPPKPKGQSKAARHQHTLSLVELAASRKGQWPAPLPSPVVPAIGAPPPPPSISTSTSASHKSVDLLGGDDPFSSFSSAGSVTSSVSLPAMLNPSQSTTAPAAPPGFGTFLSPMSTATSPPTQSASSNGSNQWLLGTSSALQNPGGLLSGAGSKSGAGTSSNINGTGSGTLSAQDLSFFEGL
ncbi:hypothetical protein K474DRAFT_1769602 [Panus rudis PR-1116 ss-1]|nr:hypothetical protein K474DRAFT_1769602 [Panus rudis PR-1116 ss-1]